MQLQSVTEAPIEISKSLPQDPITTLFAPIVYVVLPVPVAAEVLRAVAIVGTIVASVTEIEAPVELLIVILE
jgi:hypothetical protein